MKKIILYTSGQLKKTRKTGGVKRFIELLTFLPDLCKVIFVSGDESYSTDTKIEHISTHQKITYDSELKYAIHNYRVLQSVKKMNYDAIVAFDVPPAIWLALFRVPNLCLMVRKELISYERILLENSKCSWMKSKIKLILLYIAEEVTMLYADKIIVQCEFDKNKILERHIFTRKILSSKIIVQINNVNPSWMLQMNSFDTKVVTKKEFKIVSINDFSSTRKGCDIFLSAIKQLTDKGVYCKAYIAGDGILLEKYKEEYRDYQNINFIGRISNPVEFIADKDIVVVPSRADSCPNTVLEALYNNIPVIASNVGGIPEILKLNEFLFEPNKDSLEEKLIYYLDKEKLKQLSKKQKLITQDLKFDWVKNIYNIIIS